MSPETTQKSNFTQKKNRKKNHKKSHGRSASGKNQQPPFYLYGNHAVRAALYNHNRQIDQLYYRNDIAEDILLEAKERKIPTESVPGEFFEKALDRDSLHQGICIKTHRLPEYYLEDFLPQWQQQERVTLIILDQVEDSRNLGAVLRSSCCLGAEAVLCTDRHSAHENPHLAKTASGALEIVPIIRITNLARTIEQLKEAGFWCYGFAGDGQNSLQTHRWPSHSALIFGAEGRGLRRLSRELCDQMITIPQDERADRFGVDSLNLAQSVTLGLYARNIAEDS